jgi:hypothetical protein
VKGSADRSPADRPDRIGKDRPFPRYVHLDPGDANRIDRRLVTAEETLAA